MNTHVLSTLEFTKIIEALSLKCETPRGRILAKNLVPVSDLTEIEKSQNETEDAVAREESDGSLSFSGVRDIGEAILRLQVAAGLSMRELLDISMLLKTAVRVKKYGEPQETTRGTRALDPYFTGLSPLSDLQKEIDRVILSEDTVADDASPALRKIRRGISECSARVHTELNKIVAGQSAALQDHIITMRNGRYCLPVKSEYRSQFPGMVHDESGTGSTVFIEPLSVVKLNNEIRELEIEERKEIERILAELSGNAASFFAEIKNDFETLSYLDFVFAKAKLARSMKATRPVFKNDRSLLLHNARHPLLDPKKAVPISLSLGKEFTTLIITGPNTGGKTVSLKTVGLLTLMGQAGLHIPADPLSELSVFTEVFADIGDEQSIEQNLSTFSAHMKNIVEILRSADENSLILFDELCAGTDPQEGAALAMAILAKLREESIRCMATTHYSELKLYALSAEGVENASCEFNVATLSPTYRLLLGIPGKSNAFAISGKLGLSGKLIEEAKARMDNNGLQFEDVLRNLDRSRKKMEKEQQKIGKLRYEAKTLAAGLEKEQSRLLENREKILAEAKAEARKILAEAKAQVDETIRAVNKAGKDTRELEKTRTGTRELLEKNSEPVREEKKEKSRTKAKDLHIGDAVLVLSMGARGTVGKLPDSKGNLTVHIGILQMRAAVSDVQKIEESGVKFEGKEIAVGKPYQSNGVKAQTISPEIKLLGMTRDEALSALDKYLDDASVAHLYSVRIVHGKGTGVLREAVQRFLRNHPAVKTFRQAEYGEGDAGVTVAELK